jgi:hypothetical protein
MAVKHRVVRKHTDHQTSVQRRSRIRTFKLGEGLPSPTKIRDELEQMRAVLLGHDDPPVTLGTITLMEVAEGYFSRACDLEQQILRAHAEGRIVKRRDGTGKMVDPYNQLRTQEIRSFKEMAKSATELGSRRITAADLRWRQETRGRETGV